ncbi:C40 family peptidase [Campylobacter sp. RM13119]|uniref:NlpC/P60 family protein n=1 Tax=Campylobacter TaxID=194 RepID=UPI0014737C24|nr:NlpC/P60 family protein [Campylobacter sp. RM13119]MBE3021346.1 C40 family peptidase [Campylobacter sp. 7477a]MBE3605563.1 C40 family peptidase [Campylobacter sp. RM13119]
MLKRSIVLATLIVLFTGCATLNQNKKLPINEVIKTDVPLQKKEEQTYLEAYLDKDKQDTREHKNFGSFFNKYLNTKIGGDCSGFISVVNKKHENMYFDEKSISKHYDKSGRKSKAIFNLYSSKKQISFTEPRVGDLIFFANTLGRAAGKNKDKSNITHIGIVTEVAKDGTVKFIHNYSGKITHSYMNLRQKNTYKIGKKEINSYMLRCKSNKTSCLASNRFAGYGIVR